MRLNFLFLLLYFVVPLNLQAQCTDPQCKMMVELLTQVKTLKSDVTKLNNLVNGFQKKINNSALALVTERNKNKRNSLRIKELQQQLSNYSNLLSVATTDLSNKQGLITDLYGKISKAATSMSQKDIENIGLKNDISDVQLELEKSKTNEQSYMQDAINFAYMKSYINQFEICFEQNKVIHCHKIYDGGSATYTDNNSVFKDKPLDRLKLSADLYVHRSNNMYSNSTIEGKFLIYVDEKLFEIADKSMNFKSN